MMAGFNERRATLRREEDRSGCPYITPEQIEEIADKAAVKAAEKAAVKAVELMTKEIYMQVGKSFIKKITTFVGVAATALAIWLYGKGDL